MVSPLLLDDFLLLWGFMPSCLLHRADIYLPHPPVIREATQIINGTQSSGVFPGGPHPLLYLKSEEFLHLSEATSCKTKPWIQLLPQKKSLTKDNKDILYGDWLAVQHLSIWDVNHLSPCLLPREWLSHPIWFDSCHFSLQQSSVLTWICCMSAVWIGLSGNFFWASFPSSVKGDDNCPGGNCTAPKMPRMPLHLLLILLWDYCFH